MTPAGNCRKNVDGNEVLAHLMLNIPNYFVDMTQRELAVDLPDYLARRSKPFAPKKPAPRVCCGN